MSENNSILLELKFYLIVFSIAVFIYAALVTVVAYQIKQELEILNDQDQTNLLISRR